MAVRSPRPIQLRSWNTRVVRFRSIFPPNHPAAPPQNRSRYIMDMPAPILYARKVSTPITASVPMPTAQANWNSGCKMGNAMASPAHSRFRFRYRSNPTMAKTMPTAA